MSKNIKCIFTNVTHIMCKLVSHPNILLKSKMGTQNGRLHVQPHEILYVHDTTLCNR
jgi:hypothetical protein